MHQRFGFINNANLGPLLRLKKRRSSKAIRFGSKICTVDNDWLGWMFYDWCQPSNSIFWYEDRHHKWHLKYDRCMRVTFESQTKTINSDVQLKYLSTQDAWFEIHQKRSLSAQTRITPTRVDPFEKKSHRNGESLGWDTIRYNGNADVEWLGAIQPNKLERFENVRFSLGIVYHKKHKLSSVVSILVNAILKVLQSRNQPNDYHVKILCHRGISIIIFNERNFAYLRNYN